MSLSARAGLSADLAKRDYAGAELILIKAIKQNPKSPQLLTFLGGVYFLAGSYLQCAVAMKKAEVLSPLHAGDRFTLAMAYIVLGHSDWAQPEIERLIRSQPRNALYYYWLSRVDYDRRFFAQGVEAGEKALALSPDFIRAYDSIGLCDEALGRYQEALTAYEKAAHLNLHAAPPSPWPPLELGTLLLRLNRFEEAKTEFDQALALDRHFPEARYRMGLVLEHEGKDAEAETEFKQAAALRPYYASPHYALARLYKRLGKTDMARQELQKFQQIRAMQIAVKLR